MKEILEKHGEYIIQISAVGSQTSVSPPPPIEESDTDILVLVKEDKFEEFQDSVLDDDYDYPIGTDHDYEHAKEWDEEMIFVTFRNFDDVNLIVTTSQKFYNRFVLANQTCKYLNLKGKDDRIAVFQAILYECDPHEYFYVAPDDEDFY
jgi:predicted nucleotidyltransferase